MFLSILIIWFESAGDSPPWWNYPGLELWKFVNLAVFVLAGWLVVGKRLREALRSRREVIKLELKKAQEELEQARQSLAEVEERFTKLDLEITAIREKTKTEAEAEKARLNAATEREIERMREQAKREIESAGKAARHELQRFAAHESIRLAEGILTKEIKPEDDLRLTSLSISELGRRPN